MTPHPLTRRSWVCKVSFVWSELQLPSQRVRRAFALRSLKDTSSDVAVAREVAVLVVP